MMEKGNSHSARLLFWFLWLGGFVLGFVLVGQFLIHSVAQDNLQKSTPYLLGFIWQCCVQLAALKSYQYSTRMKEPLLIMLAGSGALVVLVLSILIFRS